MTAQPLRKKTARSHPLNLAADRRLPPDWRSDHEMPILSLMRWGLENGLTIEPPAPGHPDQGQVEAMLELLARRKASKVITFLTNPQRTGYGEALLAATALEQLTCSMDAAALLLQALCDSIVATNA